MLPALEPEQLPRQHLLARAGLTPSPTVAVTPQQCERFSHPVKPVQNLLSLVGVRNFLKQIPDALKDRPLNRSAAWRAVADSPTPPACRSLAKRLTGNAHADSQLYSPANGKFLLEECGFEPYRHQYCSPPRFVPPQVIQRFADAIDLSEILSPGQKHGKKEF